MSFTEEYNKKLVTAEEAAKAAMVTRAKDSLLDLLKLFLKKSITEVNKPTIKFITALTPFLNHSHFLYNNTIPATNAVIPAIMK